MSQSNAARNTFVCSPVELMALVENDEQPVLEKESRFSHLAIVHLAGRRCNRRVPLMT